MTDDCPKLSYEELLESYTRICNQVVKEIKKNNAIWNEAIKAAAKLADTSKGYPTTVSENIRRLKR